jgi:hypothetical protein
MAHCRQQLKWLARLARKDRLVQLARQARQDRKARQDRRQLLLFLPIAPEPLPLETA